MIISIGEQSVHARLLAAVRRDIVPGGVGSAWKPALDQVWAYIRGRPGLWAGGHNVFLYHHPARPGAPMRCDFGVEVTRTFEPDGEVYATETPAGQAVVAVYRGPYAHLREAHEAISDWMPANGREFAGQSWEIYGDPTPDPASTQTTVIYLLTQR